MLISQHKISQTVKKNSDVNKTTTQNKSKIKKSSDVTKPTQNKSNG